MPELEHYTACLE